MINKRSRLFAVQLVAGVIFTAASLSQYAAAQAAPPLTGLAPDHATMSVENLDLVAGWYERVLGFKVVNRVDASPDLTILQLAIPGYRIDLAKSKGSARPPKPNSIYQQQGWLHVVFNVTDMAAALKTLESLTKVSEANKDPNGNLGRIVLHDPEGNEVEIVKRP